MAYHTEHSCLIKIQNGQEVALRCLIHINARSQDRISQQEFMWLVKISFSSWEGNDWRELSKSIVRVLPKDRVTHMGLTSMLNAFHSQRVVSHMPVQHLIVTEI